jgi:hypothetical protein
MLAMGEKFSRDFRIATRELNILSAKSRLKHHRSVSTTAIRMKNIMKDLTAVDKLSFCVREMALLKGRVKCSSLHDRSEMWW